MTPSTTECEAGRYASKEEGGRGEAEMRARETVKESGTWRDCGVASVRYKVVRNLGSLA